MTAYRSMVRSGVSDTRLSFGHGFARALDLFGVFRNRSRALATKSEVEALAQDWTAVNKDLQRAFDRAGCR